ncbi:group I truncated hemoglobin [Natronorubrum daqingense]|uniref:Hemoglobin n=1 Tax=Natronorubrum daqingense TaxID=588898 RepID=A0A1N7F5A3_9EURY|nr:group 1 truncated hemoglobin [Natronorubrum daqingense]APX97541.1 group 1 truncated hemoglobin [Natronorubrum daqingense]SIR95511.1 hemoglobin [Natronorubrum daqingense]
MSETLYERLGGQEAIGAVVERFYERVLADEQVAHYFDDVDMQKQRAHQTQFISAVAGGPVDYSGEDMETAHEDLGITTADFNAIAAHLEATLEAFEVDADDRDAVLAAVGEYEDDIVTVTA